MTARRVVRWVAAAALVAGVALTADAAWLHAKAKLAEVLIARAFERHLADGRPHRPWRWADHHPLARLEHPRLGIERHVLSGASGSSMAFGVGHVDGTAPPNRPGHCVLAGHRDSWLAFLRDVRPGDELLLHTRGEVVRYVVRGTAVVDERDRRILEPTDRTRLSLVTCYPFGALLPGPLRYVVVAEPRPAGAQRQ